MNAEKQIVEKQKQITYRITHDLCVRCGSPVGKRCLLFCTSCQEEIDKKHKDCVVSKPKKSAQKQRSLHESKKKSIQNPEKPVACVACKSEPVKPNISGLAEHQCRNCVWGRWEGNVMFCPFPTCVTQNSRSTPTSSPIAKTTSAQAMGSAARTGGPAYGGSLNGSARSSSSSSARPH